MQTLEEYDTVKFRVKLFGPQSAGVFEPRSGPVDGSLGVDENVSRTAWGNASSEVNASRVETRAYDRRRRRVLSSVIVLTVGVLLL